MMRAQPGAVFSGRLAQAHPRDDNDIDNDNDKHHNEHDTHNTINNDNNTNNDIAHTNDNNINTKRAQAHPRAERLGERAKSN